jgi:hypothetical protein
MRKPQSKREKNQLTLDPNRSVPEDEVDPNRLNPEELSEPPKRLKDILNRG